MISRPRVVDIPDQNIVLGPNAYGFRQAVVDHWEPCGTEYPDTTMPTSPVSVCSGFHRADGTLKECGFYAVGHCATCHKPVCTEHGERYIGSLRCWDCRAKANRPTELAAVAKREAERAAQRQRAAQREAQLAEAASRGEPTQVEPAAKALLNAAVQKLQAADFPYAESRPLRQEKRWGKWRTTEWMTGYLLWTGTAPQYSTDHRGPREDAPEYFLTSDGTIRSWTRTWNEWSADTYRARAYTQRPDDLARLAFLVARQAARVGVSVSVPFVLTTHRDLGDQFVELRTGSF